MQDRLVLFCFRVYTMVSNSSWFTWPEFLIRCSKSSQNSLDHEEPYTWSIHRSSKIQMHSCWEATATLHDAVIKAPGLRIVPTLGPSAVNSQDTECLRPTMKLDCQRQGTCVWLNTSNGRIFIVDWRKTLCGYSALLETPAIPIMMVGCMVLYHAISICPWLGYTVDPSHQSIPSMPGGCAGSVWYLKIFQDTGSVEDSH